MNPRFLLLLPLALASCALGPDYQRPVVDTPPDWRWKPATPSDSSDKGPWWELFEDPVLNDLQNRAYANNQNLKAAVARVDQARAGARVSKADFLPDLTLNPSYERYRTSPNTGSRGRGNFPSRTENQFNFPLDLSYEIDLWGKVRRGFESARNELLASASAYRHILFTLQSDVAVRYFQLRQIDHEIDILRQTLELRTLAVKLFKERAQSGLTSELDVSRAETELAEVEAEMAAARRRRASSEATLAILVGEPAARFSIEPNLVRIKVPEIAAGLPSTLLERRPDVAEAERKLAARNAEIGVAYAAFFPSIRLTASGGFQSVELKDLFSWESRVWSFGPNVSLPLFAGGRNAAALRQARAAYEEAVATYRQSLLVAFSEVDDSLAGLLYLREELTAQARATAAARKASTLSIDRYQAGIINYLELIDTERNRLENEVRLVQITAQQLITTVQLIKALGGGWDPATAGATSPHSL